jgi:hypothetical protein
MPFSLFVAVPSHSASIHLEGAATLLAFQELALSRGWEFQFIHESASVISQLRNIIVARFLASGADLLVMLDSDQAASAETVRRMIDFEKPVVAAVYRKRSYLWDRVNFENAANLEELLYPGHEYVGNLEADADGKAEIVDGFVKAVQVGTGLIFIRREVFEQLMGAYPELHGKGYFANVRPTFDPSHNWGFFNLLESDDGTPLSEDLSFCRRWRGAGGEIWANVADAVPHFGLYAYSGNYLDYLNVMAKIGGGPRSE